MNIIEKQLLATKGLDIAPSEKPYWLASNTISPFYINTQYLCGGKEKASEILNWISIYKDSLTFL